MKNCNKCKRNLDESCFSPASGGKYLRAECKECTNLLCKKRKVLKKLHKPPQSDYKCPICLRGEEELIGTGGKAGIWVLDHDHKSDNFRGFICHQCNRGIGIFGDDIERLMRCIKYLTHSGCE